MWKQAIELLFRDKLYGINSIKCSTSMEKVLSNQYLDKNERVIILYINTELVKDKKDLRNIGKNIIDKMNYKNKQWLSFKTNIQTRSKDIPYTPYRIKNHLYKPKPSFIEEYIETEECPFCGIHYCHCGYFG